MSFYRKFVILSLFVFAVLLASGLNAQTNNGNSASKTEELNGTTQETPAVQLEGEIVLEEISIEAVIEKPRVSIVPKRMNPEFGELEFVDRSFDHELKSFPQKPLIKDDRLFKPQKIKNFAKKIAANKKKTNNLKDRDKQ